MLDSPWVPVSCDEDVGEVGGDEVEELLDRPGTTKGTKFAVLQLIFLWSNGNYTRDLRRVFRVKELPVYLREALSRVNPIL